MSQQPWATVPLSVTIRRKAVGACDENTRAQAALAEGPSSSIGTCMKTRQALFTKGTRDGGKVGNRKMSGANWLAILAELMSPRFSGRPALKGRR